MAIRKSLLPSAYQQVEYIESSGTQYIDTQVNADSKLNVFLDFQFIDGTSTQQVGAINRDGSTSYYFRHHLQFNTTAIAYGFGRIQGVLNVGTSNTNRHTIQVKNTEIIYDGVSTTISVDTFDTGVNYYLFARNTTNLSVVYSTMRIYSSQLYYDGSLVRNYIPCYRKSDSVIGLYDTVNGVFYTNAGTGTFTKGNDVMPKVKKLIKNNDYVVRAYKGSSLYYNALPSEFQQCEYIQSNENQYIDTGVNADVGTKALVSFSFVNNYSSEQYILGKTWYDNGGFSIGYATNASASQLISQAGHTILYNGTIDTNKHLISLTIDSSTSATFVVDGTSVSDTITFTKSANNIPIFGRVSSANVVSNKSSAKLYFLKIYQDNKLVRYFIPCYRISDTTIGLYDLVNGVFYTNAGTGTFTKGSDI